MVHKFVDHKLVNPKIIDTFALTLTKMEIVEEELEKVAET